MDLTLKTDMFSVISLYVILLQGVLGTFFPPVSNPPPIPGQGIRTLENSPQEFYVQGNFPQDFPPSPHIKEGLFPHEEKVDEQRWYFEENKSDETSQFQSPTETFDRYYPSGEPAIGPVATPIPDDTYISQPSSISKINPNEPANSNIWILTRGSDYQYMPHRWVQVQLPAERFVEVVNQNSGPPIATDSVKSVAAPVSLEVPVKTQFTANTLASIIQQVWFRSPNTLSSEAFENPPDIVEEVPSVKQIVDIPTGNVKQVIQQQIINDASTATPPLPDPASAPLTKKSFTAPPPLPPPLKEFDTTSKIVSSVPVNVFPDSNALGDNGSFQRIRHIWVPTSAKTGKFISFPSSTAASSESIINTPLFLDSTPVTVSDTWILKHERPIPRFEQRKSVLPPPETHSKKIFQETSVIKVDAPPNPPIIAQVDSPKNAAGKSIDLNTLVDVWPAREDVTSSKVTDKFSAEIAPDLLPASLKSEGISITKSFSVPPLTPQKTIASPKSPIPPQIPPPPVKVSNGKPCPIPPPSPQKYLLSPRSSAIIAIPRVVATQRRPLVRIIRVNRYLSNSYDLLNSRIRPSYLNYPNAALLQQSKTQFARHVQVNQIPSQFQSKQFAAAPLQTKQISVPGQSKQLPAPIPAKQVAFPFPARQTIVPVLSPASTRIIYPGLQAIKYAYPWNGYSKYNSFPGRGGHSPQFSLQKATLHVPNSDSSSEKSSESSSSETEGKKEKLKKEEKLKNDESNSSDERERESSSEEKESKKTTSEVELEEESIDAAESKISRVPANTATFTNADHTLPENSKPHRLHHYHQNIAPHHQDENTSRNHQDQNSIPQRQKVSDTDGKMTTSHLHNHPEIFHKSSKHVSDIEGLKVDAETNKPNAATHERAHLTFIPNQVTNSDDKLHPGIEESTDNMTTAFVKD